ncbi:hypothetical protein KY330_02460 [Candidatus Woesearchaeota archaeon]|nr:hypothetical protein [Candidatus Woesearchaeota archaeon]
MEIDNIIIALICTLLILPIVSAEISVNIDVKDEFKVGDTMMFNYSIISDEDLTVSFSPSIMCPSLLLPEYISGPVDILADEPFYAEYVYMEVTGDLQSQTCTASIEIFEPLNLTKVEKFDIKTPPNIDFNINFCKDQLCSDESKVFVLGKRIYLDYESSISGLDLESSIIYPDNSEQEISLPFSIEADQLGIYRLEITAEKEGYRNYNNAIEFSVIEEEPEITIIQACNSNLICDGSENYLTCPSECKSGSKDSYCDGVSDDRCDPDCDAVTDPDCKEVEEKVLEEEEISEVIEDIEEQTQQQTEPEQIEQERAYLWVWILLILIILTIFLEIKHKKNKPKNILTQD